jgi:hypothetical protein
MKVSASMIEKAWIGNFAGELFSKQGHLGAAVVGAIPEMKFKPVTRVEVTFIFVVLKFCRLLVLQEDLHSLMLLNLFK